MREEELLLHGIFGSVGTGSGSGTDSSTSSGTGSSASVFDRSASRSGGIFGGASGVLGSVNRFASCIFGGISSLGGIGSSSVGLGRFSRSGSRGRRRCGGGSRRGSGSFFFFAASSDSNSDQCSDQERLVHGSILLMEYEWGPEWNEC